MFCIGLTGGIGTGKSTVSAMLAGCGVPIVDADRLAREVVKPGSSALREIAATFGADVLDDQGALRRARLGEIVFSDPDARRRLEAITHPRILALQHAAQRSLEAAGRRLAVFDIPLLFEAAADVRDWLHWKVVVVATREQQLTRLIERGLTPADAQKRIAAQMPMEEKVRLADEVIDNTGDIESLRVAVQRCLQRWNACADRADRPR